jgi:hypothetical protein
MFLYTYFPLSVLIAMIISRIGSGEVVNSTDFQRLVLESTDFQRLVQALSMAPSPAPFDIQISDAPSTTPSIVEPQMMMAMKDNKGNDGKMMNKDMEQKMTRMPKTAKKMKEGMQMKTAAPNGGMMMGDKAVLMKLNDDLRRLRT